MMTIDFNGFIIRIFAICGTRLGSRGKYILFSPGHEGSDGYGSLW